MIDKFPEVYKENIENTCFDSEVAINLPYGFYHTQDIDDIIARPQTN